MSIGKPTREVRVERNIYRTPHGWRVYVKVNGKQKPKRFPPHATLEELRRYVNDIRLNAEQQRREQLLQDRRQLTEEARRGFANAKRIELEEARAKLRKVRQIDRRLGRPISSGSWRSAGSRHGTRFDGRTSSRQTFRQAICGTSSPSSCSWRSWDVRRRGPQRSGSFSRPHAIR